ncbi:MAG TPA: 3-deoxy-7-phosphoheptulonate synthase, partial [Agromyces sp.]
MIAGLDYWRDLPIKQQPTWPDPEAARAASAELATLPPLVFAGEVDTMRDRLAAASRGEAFLLQGGDCAETFAGATADQIRNRVKTVLQMAVVLTYGASMPIVKMGRMAGQFAKPRSSDSETRGEVTLPAYRGDIVNGYDFTEGSRQADPQRLLKGYHTAASTINLIRAVTQGGFADLREVHSWNKGFAQNPANQQYERLATEIDRAIKFMEAAGADFDELKRVEFYTGHEGLLMDYERPMTRIDSRTGTPYNTSAHFLWIGERTRDLDGAHVDYFSKIRNPIGVKLGPTTTPETALALIDKLDPERLLRVYNTSAATLNLVRAFTQGGLADLREVHSWNQGFVASSSAHQRYEAMARDIDRALAFMAACGVDPEEFRTVDLYSSHEALLLDYERALTRTDSRTGRLYDTS